eukprot:5430536-Karenia_brevis.AAC.1
MPLPVNVFLSLLGLSLSCDCLSWAAGLAVGFHCFLRTNELMSLRCNDVLIDSQHGVVVLHETKKGFRDIVSIHDQL